MNTPQLDVASFVTQFPEWKKVDPDVLNAALGRAAIQIDADVWAEKATAAQGLLASHFLALAPMGQNMRLKARTTETVYWKAYEELRLTLGVGVLVSGNSGLTSFGWPWF